MDSLLYIGAGADDDDDDDDDEEEEEQAPEEPVKPAPAPAAKAPLDYEALKRAGYSNSSSDLAKTATYQRLESEAAAARDGEAARLLEEEKAAAEQAEAAEKLRSELLDRQVCVFAHSAEGWASVDSACVRQAIDKKIGYEKRYDRTHEDFRSKVCASHAPAAPASA